MWDKGGRREGEEGRVGEKREGEREREGKREVHVYGWKVPRQIRRKRYMLTQSTRQGKAKQLHPKTTPFSPELPQAGFKPTTYCILCRCSTN